MYLERETADELLQEEHGRIRRLLLKCRNKAKACAFVNRCILVHLFALLFCLSDNAGSGNEFDINLDLFTGEGCLLIWFWLIYRFLLGRACFQPESFHAAIKTSDRACIPFFAQAHPETDFTFLNASDTIKADKASCVVPLLRESLLVDCAHRMLFCVHI